MAKVDFTLTVPHDHHDKIAAVLDADSNAVLNDDKKSGILVDPATGGIVKFRVKGGVTEFTIIKNGGLTPDQIKTKIQGQHQELVGKL
jgi:hypothetical protein